MTVRARQSTIALALLAALAGCSGGDPGDPPPPAAGATPDPELIERLRSLPYAGTAVDGDDREGVVLHDRARSWPGLNLYAVQMLALAELIDSDGRVLRRWEDPEGGRWERAELLDDGDLLVIGAAVGPDGPPGIPDGARYLMRFDADGRVRWRRSMTAHHDVEQTPDGELHALTFRRLRVPEIHPDLDVRDDRLTRLDGDGNVLEHVSLLEAFANGREAFRLAPVGPNDLGVVPWLDLFHANSLETIVRDDLAARHPLYAPGNVLICLRHQNCVAVVDGRKPRVVWAWGPGELSGPHDARLLDSGNILIFDNGVGRGWSRVIELDPVAGRIVWEYRAPDPESFYTISKGSSQRLPNGNTLIASSDQGRAFEVTAEGEMVWEFLCPHRVGERRAAIVRLVRIPAERAAAFERR